MFVPRVCQLLVATVVAALTVAQARSSHASAVIHYSCVNPTHVALTFDDGPGPKTGQLLDTLSRHNVKATFFVLGNELETQKNKEVLGRAFREGHQIASHTYSHRNLNELSSDEIRQEMTRTSDAIHQVIQKRPRYMRPPYGEVNENAKAVLGELGYKIIHWNLDSHDWRYEFKPDEQHMVLENIRNGMRSGRRNSSGLIVLQHDSKDFSVDLVAKIIRIIRPKSKRRKTVKFVTAAECIGDPSGSYQ